MSEPVWIEPELVLAIHDRQLAEHGGAEGLRDASLLDGALGRVVNHFHYTQADIIELAGKYCAGIVQNHAFVDGNKRTGLVVCILFLELNGYHFKASEADAAQIVQELAAHTVDEDGLREFLRANVEPVQVPEPACSEPPT
jgi:death-on-curing protein